MEKVCSGLTAIVVGTTRQRAIRETTAYLDRINISYKVCEDIYSAAAAIGAAPAGVNLLVVGDFTTLASENMRLFSLAPKNVKVYFCCIVSKWFDNLRPRLLEAARSGVFVLDNAGQIENVIEQCTGLGDTAVVSKKAGGRDFASRIAALADNFFLTKAEQDALLGVEDDANTENSVFTQ